MKLRLPILLKLFLIFLPLLFFIFSYKAASAQEVPTPTPDPTTGWVKDQEVTFIGKTATRANEFLEWTLSKENYRWVYLTESAGNPIQDFWVVVRNIVFVLLALFVLGAAFVMIITRGQNLTVMRFIPRFIMIVILVLLSFAIIRFLYQAVDVVQGFFLNIKDPISNENRNIGPQDLLYIAFNYESFIGYRKVGLEFDESAFISLLLVKLTAITYYVMTGLLLIRKIILWFFIIVSPIFPLLLFFRPVRNTAKIWVGEFFRWLLYAPLFALFLHGLVNVWRSGIPMYFIFPKTGDPLPPPKFPTAINILLGGPGQQISLDNSVNLPDTFALYVVALLMLWVVILLPFLLLQIFLDYLNNVSIAENPMVKKITNNSWFNRAYGGTPPPTPPGQPPQQPSPFGLAKNIPFFNKRTLEMPQSKGATVNTNTTLGNVSRSYSASNINTTTVGSTNISNIQNIRETKDVLKLANLSVPKMRDIARYETSMTRRDTTSKNEVSRFHESLERISKPTIAAAPQDRERFTSIKEKLVLSQQKGDPLATSVLNASKVTTKSTQVVRENTTNTVREVLKGLASPASIESPAEKTRITNIRQELISAKEKGDTVATAILETAEKVSSTTVTDKEKETLVEKSVQMLHEQAKKGDKLALTITTKAADEKTPVQLPTINRVQQVSIEEYEDVKKMWQENYQNMDTPIGPSGIPMEKHSFIQQDVDNITETINLLSSQEQPNVDKGMERVANILPFLLLGGFSKSEVISYLKAKLEAGKFVLSNVDKKEDEDTLLDRAPEQKTGHQEMAMHQELPVEDKSALIPEKDSSVQVEQQSNDPNENDGSPTGKQE